MAGIGFELRKLLQRDTLHRCHVDFAAEHHCSDTPRERSPARQLPSGGHGFLRMRSMLATATYCSLALLGRCRQQRRAVLRFGPRKRRRRPRRCCVVASRPDGRAIIHRPNGGLRAIVGVDLAKDCLNVNLHGSLGNIDLAGDALVRVSVN
jgi:hypothetical protein